MKRILEYLFPKFCVSCKIEGVYLCKNCAEDILEVKSQTCPKCGRLSDSGRYCLKCRKGKFLKGIICATYFEEGPIKEIIHNFKYNSLQEFSKILGLKMADSGIEFTCFDYITFVPLHRKRLAQRGYNQAQLLSEEIAKIKHIKCENLLIKVKHTKRQVGLIGSKRRRNLESAFRINKEIEIENKKIIIVDDISTTGTTLNECARVLREAGAKEIWGLVVARG